MTQPLVHVRRHLQSTRPSRILIACSGGADSLALAWLAEAAARDIAVDVHAAAVDHELQADSDAVAVEAMRLCKTFGIGTTQVLKVKVTPAGEGLEAAARRARRDALTAHARNIKADEIWLAHTLDDQAETVLIGLTHGSGARSLAGMPDRDGMWVRPLLQCRRADVHAALPSDVTPWQDPHNEDPQFLRARVRHELLPVMNQVLGDKAVVSLARTAELLTRDNDALDAMATDLLEQTGRQRESGFELQLDALADTSVAVLGRVLRRACLAAGVNARDLTMQHIDLLTRLVKDKRVQGPVALPGLVSAERQHERLMFLRHSAADSGTSDRVKDGPAVGSSFNIEE